MKEYKLIYAEWRDTTTIPDWYSEYNIVDVHPATIYSIGWLVREDPEFIVIAASLSPTSEMFSQISVIPRGCLVTCRDFNIPT